MTPQPAPSVLAAVAVLVVAALFVEVMASSVQLMSRALRCRSQR
jgi:hypothetical protein